MLVMTSVQKQFNIRDVGISQRIVFVLRINFDSQKNISELESNFSHNAACFMSEGR